MSDRLAFALRHPRVTLAYLLTRDPDLIEVQRIVDRADDGRRTRPDLPAELDDLAEYLGLPRTLCARNMLHGTELVARQWQRADPRTTADTERFYAGCGEYLYLLAYHNSMPRYRELLEMFRDVRGQRGLSFGGGIGSEALWLAAQDNEVWYLDRESSPVWDFTAFRVERTGARVHLCGEIPGDVPFDFVAALNVFNVMPADAMEGALRALVGVLKQDGRLYCQNNFDYMKHMATSQSGAGDLWEGRLRQHHDHTELWASVTAELGLVKESEQVYRKAVES